MGRKGHRNKITIYDKQKEVAEKTDGRVTISHPCTRIEINSVPTNGLTIGQLQDIVLHEPFRTLNRYKVIFKPPTTENARLWERYGRFEERCKLYGFFKTRRMLNKESGNNFLRLYGDFFELEELTPTLDEIFQIGIRGFVQRTE